MKEIIKLGIDNEWNENRIDIEIDKLYGMEIKRGYKRSVDIIRDFVKERVNKKKYM